MQQHQINSMKKSRPVKKGFTPFKENQRSKNIEKETPSGFNRKKYFDTANDLFADKQDKKKGGKPGFDETRKKNSDDSDDKSRFKKDLSADGAHKSRFSKDTGDRKSRFSDSGDSRSRFSKDADDDKKSRFSSDRKSRFSKDADDDKKSHFSSDRKSRFDKKDKKTHPRKEASEDKSHRKRIVKEKTDASADSNEMPLNKFISHSGISSRRKAVDFIKEGKVTVNGVKIEEPAFKVTDKDNVQLNGKRITRQKNLVYVLLNKPKGYITTTDDPEGRQTVMELVEDAADERLFPVGRLDRNTSGLLLLTNDGELAQKLAHPKHNIKKIYHVELDKPLTKADFEKILAGVQLEDGDAFVDALGYVDTKDKKQIGIEIHSGRNRIVRRIFEHLEYKVEKLDRVMYAGLTKKNLNRGKWRFLSEKEVILLKHFK